MAVCLVLAEVFHELLCHHESELVSLLIVVAEWECRVAFLLKAYCYASFVADDAHLAVLDSCK